MLLDDVEVLKAIFTSLAAGIVVCDETGKLRYFNPEAERILGIGAQPIGPEDWTPTYGCYRPDTVTPYPAQELPLARAIKGEEVLHELIFIRNPEQPHGVWISVSGRPLRYRDGSIRGGVVVFRDVTAAQSVLRGHPLPAQACGELTPEEYVEQLTHFRSYYDQLCRAVEQTADSVLITDRRGAIEYVNPAFEQTTGYAAAEILGQTPRVLKSGYHDAGFYRELWAQLLKGEAFRGTILNRKKSGETYWAEQTITPIHGDSGEVTHFVSVLKDVTEQRKRQEQEFYLQLAREIQQRFYRVAASVPGLDVAGAAFPAALTGGDYFDFIKQPDGGLFVVIGDVSGHGFGAALLMAEVRAYVRSFLRFESDPGAVLSDVNRVLAADLDGRRFVTLLLVRIDPEHRCVQYAGAGHEPAYVVRASCEGVLTLPSMGPPLGLVRDLEYESSEPMGLEQGDTMLLLTDGVTESVTGEAAEFGPGGALDFVRGNLAGSAQELAGGICGAALAFAGGEQKDDLAAVVCRFTARA